MTAILDFGAAGGFIAGSLLLAFVLEWLGLLGLMSLMPLPARPSPNIVSLAAAADKSPAKQTRELRPRR
jgi:hypothetical protein